MRVIIVAFGRRLVDLELLAPLTAESTDPAPGHDPFSTTAAQVEQADDGVRADFGFVTQAREKR